MEKKKLSSEPLQAIGFWKPKYLLAISERISEIKN